MTVVKCDMCNKEIAKSQEYMLPRIMRTYARGGKGEKLAMYDKYGVCKTDLCELCCTKIANLLPVIEE